MNNLKPLSETVLSKIRSGTLPNHFNMPKNFLEEFMYVVVLECDICTNEFINMDSKLFFRKTVLNNETLLATKSRYIFDLLVDKLNNENIDYSLYLGFCSSQMDFDNKIVQRFSGVCNRTNGTPSPDSTTHITCSIRTVNYDRELLTKILPDYVNTYSGKEIKIEQYTTTFNTVTYIIEYGIEYFLEFLELSNITAYDTCIVVGLNDLHLIEPSNDIRKLITYHDPIEEIERV